MKNTKLIQLREALGLSQEEAARLIGVNRSTYAMIEAGHRIGSYPTLKKIAKFFGTTVDEIVERNFFADECHVSRAGTGTEGG